MRPLLIRSACFALCGFLVLPSSGRQSEPLDVTQDVRQFEIVPCLLPARIRKLGNMTYPERRKLVEISARQCELKGGEYTFYDRGQPESAAAFFKKLVDDGNVDAQVSLGDVYQYLFPEPDYAEAAHWYKAASENGSKRGMMALARLYERGLGVPEDGLMATNLWREATGAGEELVLASELEQARTEADERIAELSNQLRERNENAEALRRELRLARNELSQRRASLAAAEADLDKTRQELEKLAGNAGAGADVARLREQVAEQQRIIDDQRYQIETVEADMGVQEAQLTASLRQAELQNERLEQELSRVTAKSDDELQAALERSRDKEARLAALQQELEAARSELASVSAEYEERVAALEQAREQAADGQNANDRRIGKLEAARAEQASKLESQRRELERLSTELAAASSESESLRRELDQQIHATREAEARFAQTEAELQLTRDQMSRVRAELEAANDQLARLDEERSALEQQLAAGTREDRSIEQLQEQLQRQNERVNQQQALIGKLEQDVETYRSDLREISLRRASFAHRTPMEDTSNIRLPSDVKLGRYYALVIGNNNYEHLNDLENAINDARGVHQVLQDEYEFSSTLLLDASQKQIFQAFQELAATTSPADLVLIYYAGHGYEIKNESYWLPVEVQSRAEAEVSGISSLKVADWVRAMAANHVMIIADSCYSGSGIETTGGFRYSVQDLQKMLPFFMKSRSRTMLASGSLAPVMDGDGSGGDFSIFTKELIALLKENRGVLYGEALYDHLVERVKYTPDGVSVNQTPLFGAIESAGHESGQFVLVHRLMGS